MGGGVAKGPLDYTVSFQWYQPSALMEDDTSSHLNIHVINTILQQKNE